MDKQTNWTFQVSGCLFLALVVALTISMLGTGARNLYEVYQYSHSSPITYERLLTSQPSAGWFTISGGSLDVKAATFLKEKTATVPLTEVSDLFVPLRDAAVAANSARAPANRIDLLVKTSDSRILDIFRRINKTEGAKLAESDNNYLQRPIQGMIGSSLHSVTRDDEENVRKGLSNLSANFIILDEGAAPSLPKGIGLSIGGLILAAVELLLFVAASERRNPVVVDQESQANESSAIPLEYRLLDAPEVQVSKSSTTAENQREQPAGGASQQAQPEHASSNVPVENAVRAPRNIIYILGCLASCPLFAATLVMLVVCGLLISEKVNSRSPNPPPTAGAALAILVLLVLVALQILIIVMFVRGRRSAKAAARAA